jgi:hypothetical protein
MLAHRDAREWLYDNRHTLFECLEIFVSKKRGSCANSYLLDVGYTSITGWISASNGLWLHCLNRKSIIAPEDICCLRIRWQDFSLTQINIHNDWSITVERQFRDPSHSYYAFETKMIALVMDWLCVFPAYRKATAQKQTAAMKEELISTALHPRRIESWLEQGVELEAM